MHKIIDAHCHIYPEKIAARAVEGIHEFYDIEMRSKGTVDDLIETGSAHGCVHYLCHSVATTPHQVKSICEFIAGEVNKHPGLITGFGSLHPDSEDIEGDIEHLINLGLKGVKLHPDFQKFEADSPKAVKMFGAIADAGLPVLVHCGDKRYDYSNPDRISNLLDKLPNLTMIGAHFGGWSLWEEATEVLAGRDNLYVDCCSSLYALSPQTALRLIGKYGADRVFFGTDYPMWPIEDEIERFDKIGLTEEESEMILWKNAAGFLGIEV